MSSYPACVSCLFLDADEPSESVKGERIRDSGAYAVTSQFVFSSFNCFLHCLVLSMIVSILLIFWKLIKNRLLALG
jgi:hypothetical protein